MVTWSSEGQEGGSYPYYGVYQQAYNADGTARGGEVRVNTYTYGNQNSSQIAALADGGWVVTWTPTARMAITQASTSRPTMPTAHARGGEVRVNTYTSGEQNAPTDTALADGGWVVTWISRAATTVSTSRPTMPMAQPAAARSGSTPTSELHQAAPQITALADGGWVVTWTALARTAPRCLSAGLQRRWHSPRRRGPGQHRCHTRYQRSCHR